MTDLSGTWLPAATSLLVSGAVTAAICPRVIVVLRNRSIVDAEGHRTSHVGVVPRGGGIAVLAGLVAGLGLTFGAWRSSPGAIALALATVAFAAVGLRDDLGGLRATTRLAVQIGLSGLFALSVVPHPLAPIGLAVLAGVAAWLVLFVNAFNFMDGINGISSATTAIIATSLAIASFRWHGGIEVPALALVGAAVAFAPFNATNRIFLGDVGSYLLGSCLAMLSVVGVRHGIPVIAVTLPFVLYVADVGFTLARRASRGAPLMEAHREHVYQRLANEGGWGHERTTLVVSACTALLAALAQIATLAGVIGLSSALLSAAVVGTYLSLPRRGGLAKVPATT